MITMKLLAELIEEVLPPELQFFVLIQNKEFDRSVASNIDLENLPEVLLDAAREMNQKLSEGN